MKIIKYIFLAVLSLFYDVYINLCNVCVCVCVCVCVTFSVYICVGLLLNATGSDISLG